MTEHTIIKIRELLHEEHLEEAKWKTALGIAAGAGLAYGAAKLYKHVSSKRKKAREVAELEKHATGDVDPKVQARAKHYKNWEAATLAQKDVLLTSLLKGKTTTNLLTSTTLLIRFLDQSASYIELSEHPVLGKTNWNIRNKQTVMRALKDSLSFKGDPIKRAIPNITRFIGRRARAAFNGDVKQWVILYMGWAPTFGGPSGSIMTIFGGLQDTGRPTFDNLVAGFSDVGPAPKLIPGRFWRGLPAQEGDPMMVQGMFRIPLTTINDVKQWIEQATSSKLVPIWDTSVIM